MGGQTPEQQPLRGSVADAGGAPQGMACGGTKRIEGRNREKGGGRPGGHTGGGRKMGKGCGTSADSVGGVPGSKRLQWSGVERGGGLTPSGGDLKQVQNVVIFKSKRDRV